MPVPPEDLKSDTLALLIGTNPIPNVVAARLLARRRVLLFHTSGTLDLAKRLGQCLRGRSKLEYVLCPILSSEPWDVREAILQGIADHSDGSFGLHYTGGKKVMAVEACRVVATTQDPCMLSYLDASTHTLFLEDAKNGRHVYRLKPGDVNDISSVHELRTLHGLSQEETVSEFPNGETCESLKGALIHIYSSDEHGPHRRWVAGHRTELNRLERGGRDSAFKDRNLLRGDAVDTLRDWLDNFCPRADTWGELGESLGVRSTNPKFPSRTGGGAETFSYMEGKWLEDVTADALSSPPSLGQVVRGIETSGPRFELDVVCLAGYQLYAMSCTTTGDKATARQKLLEVLIRAKQLGGDEANVAVIWCPPPAENPERLRKYLLDTYEAVAGRREQFHVQFFRNERAFRTGIRGWVNTWA